MFEKEAEEYANENWEYYEEGQNDSKALNKPILQELKQVDPNARFEVTEKGKEYLSSH